MNANHMWTDRISFGSDILRHYDPARLWTALESEKRYWDDMPRAMEDLYTRANLDWGYYYDFFLAVADFVERTLVPNLRDDEQGYAFRVVRRILDSADFTTDRDAPSLEVLELKFYQTLKMQAVGPALAAFLAEYWCCKALKESKTRHQYVG